MFAIPDDYVRVFFFFQAEDGIRDLTVTGVQTCALPICDHHPGDRFTVVRGDVRDADHVCSVVRSADVIYHVAGQVAVTLSVDDPRADFETNALGAFNVLEGARRSGRRPAVIFTSTNKVYGRMDDLATVEEERRYRY